MYHLYARKKGTKRYFKVPMETHRTLRATEWAMGLHKKQKHSKKYEYKIVKHHHKKRQPKTQFSAFGFKW